MSQLESKEQKKIKRYLEKLGYMVEKLESSSSGGWPDLFGLKEGRHIFIETKRPGKKANPLQEWKHKQIRAHGGEVYVFDSLVALKKEIKN